MNVHSFWSLMSQLTQSPDKRQAIFKATIELLASCGFHGFSIKQLASKAGVATGTIYLYFEDRDTLIKELHLDIWRQFAEAMLAGHDPSESLPAQHHKLCSNLWYFSINNPCILLSKAQFDHLPPDVLRSQREAAITMFEPIIQLFQNGRDSGLIKNLPDDVLCSLSFEPYVFLARQHVLGLIEIDQNCLHKIIQASWDAIAQPL